MHKNISVNTNKLSSHGSFNDAFSGPHYNDEMDGKQSNLR